MKLEQVDLYYLLAANGRLKVFSNVKVIFTKKFSGYILWGNDNLSKNEQRFKFYLKRIVLSFTNADWDFNWRRGTVVRKIFHWNLKKVFISSISYKNQKKMTKETNELCFIISFCTAYRSIGLRSNIWNKRQFN